MCYGTCCMRYTVNNMLPWSHSMEDAAHSTAHVSRSLMTCHLQLHAIAMANPCLTHDNYPHLYSHACFVLEHLSLCVCASMCISLHIYLHIIYPIIRLFVLSYFPSFFPVLLSNLLSIRSIHLPLFFLHSFLTTGLKRRLVFLGICSGVGELYTCRKHPQTLTVPTNLVFLPIGMILPLES